jgi:hypothetical protein
MNRLSWAAYAALVGVLAACGTATSAPTADSGPAPTSQPPAPSATERPLTQVPLTQGWPKTNGDDGSPVEVTGRPGLDKLVLCHEAAWTPDAPIAPVELVGSTYTGEAEDSRGLTLARYDGFMAAQDVMDHVRAVVESCPVDHEQVTHSSLADRRAGDGAFLVTQRWRTDYGFATGLVVYDFVRVGDLLLVSWASGEGGGSDESIALSQHAVTSQSDDLVPVMCDYSSEPCSPQA